MPSRPKPTRSKPPTSKADSLAALNREVRGWQADQELFDSLVIELAGINRSDWRVLDVLGTRGPLTAGQLAEAVRLTTGAVTGLLDRLEAAGLVRRSAGQDSRSTTIALTAAGRRAAHAVTSARATALDDALAVLSPAERRTFTALAGTVVAGLVAPERVHPWICRLCDTGACGRPEGRCPVANAAQVVFSS